jgi:HEPN domain-containing protein
MTDPRIATVIALAEDEHAAARLLAAGQRRQAAFYLQQAAEKLARAILAAAGIPFGTSHNLGQMAAALRAEHPWRAKIFALDRHSPAAARFRYPTPGGRLPEPPARDRIEHDATELSALIAEAKAELGLAATKLRQQ